jgi:endo-1,4-beta-mannosidase
MGIFTWIWQLKMVLKSHKNVDFKKRKEVVHDSQTRRNDH